MLAIHSSVAPWRLSFAAAIIGCALAITACGTSSSKSSHASSGGTNSLVFAECMRSHGVPNFPDASAAGGFDLPSTIDTQSPGFLSARKTCTRPLSGTAATPALSDRQQLQLIAAAKCMRGHGVNIADPTFNGQYITLDVPDQTTIASPAFKRADPVCHYPVPKNARGSTASP